MARKPFKGSTIDNVLAHGVGALNIDATRIPAEQELIDWYNRYPEQKSKDGVYENYNPEVSIEKENTQPIDTTEIQGRYPSNVLGDIADYQKYFYCPKVSRRERHRGFENPGAMFPGSRFDIYMPSKQTNPETSMLAVEKRFNNKKDPLSHIPIYDRREDGLESAGIQGLQQLNNRKHNKKDPLSHIPSQFPRSEVPGGEGKKMLNKMVEVNKKDPLAHIPSNPSGMYEQNEDGKMGERYEARVEHTRAVGNNHPTVKPVALMKYLIQLVVPKGAHILDPFMGSGTTGMAAKELGITFTGIEMDKSYCDIAKRRIDASKVDQFNKLFDVQRRKQ